MKHVQVPLSESDRRRIISEIAADRLLPRKVKNVRRLVRLVEMALDPMTGAIPEAEVEPDDDFVQQQKISKEIRKISSAAKKLDLLIEPYGMPTRSTLTWVNPFSSAVHSLFPLALTREQDTLLRILKELPAKFPSTPTGVGKTGRPTVREPARQLVRAVCYFMETEGLTPQYTWPSTIEGPSQGKRGGEQKPTADEALLPPTPTSAIIVAAAKAFHLDVHNSRLKTHLLNLKKDIKWGTGKVSEFHLGWFYLSEDEKELSKAN